MTVKDDYNNWAGSYDSTENKTRDLEKIAIRQTLSKYEFDLAIELGCGTGKNTGWLSEKTNHLISLDFSEEMLRKAKEKFDSEKINFILTDITKTWNIKDNSADLISCSLVLEHIQNTGFIFKEAGKKLKAGGVFYVCELHPFKQYSGSKARYETEAGTIMLETYVHNVSEYLQCAAETGLQLIELQEWFDNNDKTGLPRLISFLFRKP